MKSQRDLSGEGVLRASALIFFSYGADPLAEGDGTLLFSLHIRKEPKEVCELAVRSLRPSILSQWHFLLPKLRLPGSTDLTYTRKQEDRSSRFTKGRFQFDGRIGAYPSLSRVLSPARRMGTDRRGAWRVRLGFLLDG